MRNAIQKAGGKPPTTRRSDQGSPIKARRGVACIPCNARKVKCSGGHPCSSCARSRVPETCTYPVRNRKVTLTESELDLLVAERAREQRPISDDRQPEVDSHVEVTTSSLVEESSHCSANSARNPLFDEGSWFEPLQAAQMPIHIGEASDAAFATRFRQVVSASAQHIPRTQYASDAKILSLSDLECVWPPLTRARFLIKAALRVCHPLYHCVRTSEILDGLERHYLAQPVPGKYLSCKLLALFAIGELYSRRMANVTEETFPGLTYFSRAFRIVRESNERPQIENVECTLLLAMYSLSLNRRHSVYQLASSAVRQAIIIGLQQNVPEPLSPDRAFREHCVRLWWTAYTLDRLTSSKVGYPSSIQDDDVSVDQPSHDIEDEDFPDAAYLRANIALATLAKEIVSALYTRKNVQIPFARRVQSILKKLNSWLEALPPRLNGNIAQPALAVTHLHLSFNQHVILTTRPILLHVLRSHMAPGTNPSGSSEELPQALAEACINSARHSYRLLYDAWIDGQFATYDYTYTQCLFSTAVVLAISSRLEANVDDYDKFALACEWIQELSDIGNFAAMEFTQHLSALRNELPTPVTQHGLTRDLRSGTLTGPVSRFNLEESNRWLSGSDPITAEMALAEPLLQDFLLQTDLNLCLNDPMGDEELQQLYL